MTLPTTSGVVSDWLTEATTACLNFSLDVIAGGFLGVSPILLPPAARSTIRGNWRSDTCRFSGINCGALQLFDDPTVHLPPLRDGFACEDAPMKLLLSRRSAIRELVSEGGNTAEEEYQF
jgi:hypothetical protein